MWSSAVYQRNTKNKDLPELQFKDRYPKGDYIGENKKLGGGDFTGPKIKDEK
jgi:hypothetical protein